MQDLTVEQGVSGISSLLKHVYNGTDPGKMMLIGCPYFRLFHLNLPDWKGHVDDLVNFAVRWGEADGLTVARANFYYHVKVLSKDPRSPSVFLRCHPIWNQKDCQTGLPVIDWFEENWDRGDGLNYTKPAILVLWGNVIYSDDSTLLLASVCSLQSTKTMNLHNQMFFAFATNYPRVTPVTALLILTLFYLQPLWFLLFPEETHSFTSHQLILWKLWRVTTITWQFLPVRPGRIWVRIGCDCCRNLVATDTGLTWISL